VGTSATNTGPVSITDNGSSLYLADGVNRYYYTWGTATFAIIADGAFVGGDRVDVIDNFIIYTKVGSNQWGATSAGRRHLQRAFLRPQGLRARQHRFLMVNKREVFILGETTSEVWVDAGLFPFPFQKLPGTNMQHGCAAKNSVARLGETFAFLAKDDRGQSVVVHMNGYLPVRISTHAIENEIQTYSTVSDAIGFSYQQAGHEFYVLTFPTADKTWVYDLATGSGTAARFATRATSTTATARTARASSRASTWWATTRTGSSTPPRSRPSPITPTEGGAGNIPRIRRCRHLTSDLKLRLPPRPADPVPAGRGTHDRAGLRPAGDASLVRRRRLHLERPASPPSARSANTRTARSGGHSAARVIASTRSRSPIRSTRSSSRRT
jgi:hypothetical protein